MPVLTLSNLLNNEDTLSEIQIQARIYQYFYNTYPAIRGLFFSVPNEGSRTLVETRQLQASGLTVGMVDMILIWKGKVHGIEMKTMKGSLSPAQKNIHAIWKAAGVPVFVCFGIRSAFATITKILQNERDVLPC